MKREIKFQFDYFGTPIWLVGKGDRLISGDGYFYEDIYTSDGKPKYTKDPEERLKGEFQLEQKVQFIYDVYCRIWDMNEFPDGEPYIGFEDEQEKTEFFDACDYVIKRMSELFGDEFTVHSSYEETIKNRSMDCRKR